MTSDDTEPNQKKRLPGWAITMIIIASFILLLFLYKIIRKLLRMHRRKLSGVEYMIVNPKNNAKIVKKAQNRRKRQQKKNFRLKYPQYLKKVKDENPGLSKLETYDAAAAQRISDLTTKNSFDFIKYNEFKKEIPTDIKQKGDTKFRIQSIDRTINVVIRKDMNQYVRKTKNPTLEGAIGFVEKDSLQNLIKHTGRPTSSYTQLYKPFYLQALRLNNKNV